MAVEHQEFLEEILQTLTEDGQDENTPEITMQAVVAIIDDYKSELAQEESEQEERDKLAMMGIPDEDTGTSTSYDIGYVEDSEPVVIPKPINRAFLLAKARKEYYQNKLGLTEEEILKAQFTPGQKIRHRKNITAIFDKMVTAEQEKPQSESKYAKGPFKKIAGNVLVARKATEENETEVEDEDESVFDIDAVTPAQLKWQRQQTKERKTNMKNLTVEIEELERQNKIKKISPSIINRNNERIAELKEELEEIKEQQSQYN